MSDKLVERLRDFQTLEIEAREICDEAADRIGELEGRLRLHESRECMRYEIMRLEAENGRLRGLVDAAKALRTSDRPHGLCMNNAQLEHSQVLCADCRLMEVLAALEKDDGT